jgi:hypothetical protein
LTEEMPKMTRYPQPQDDPPGSEPPDLWELEERLRSFRPRNPHVDMEALERHLVDAAHGTGGADRSTVWVSRRESHWWSIAAASWMVGVAVGALIMFLVLRHADPELVTQSSPDNKHKTVRDQQTATTAEPVRSPAEKVPVPQSVASNRSIGPVPAWPTILADTNRFAYGQRPILRAGSHLAGIHFSRSAAEFPSIDAAAVGAPSPSTLPASAPAEDALPRRESTREELLKELLGVDRLSTL